MGSGNDIRLQRPTAPIDRAVCLPGSKSLTNRALLVAALASGTSRLEGILLADDTRLMIDALSRLGVAVSVDEVRRTARVVGCGGHWPADEADLACGNAGTVVRFLTAACCTGRGKYRIDGSVRMRERPIGDLVDALRAIGGEIGYEAADGYCPLVVSASGLSGGLVSVRGAASSQFVSAMLIAAPLATANDVMLDAGGALVSRPYVIMTLKVMEAFGVQVVDDPSNRFIVPCLQTYQAADYVVEPDASAASYFLGAAALTGGRVTAEGLGSESCQGDVRFVEVLESMGCRIEQGPRHTTVHGPEGGRLRGVDVDLNTMPDTAQTLAVLAAFADGPTRIRNVANLRIKETDRLAALSNELASMQVRTEVHEDGLSILPDGEPSPAAIATYDDHRMAMSFALAGLKLDGMVIRDADCVGKTFPEFFTLWSDW